MGIPQTMFLILGMTACVLFAGCVLVSGSSPVPPAVPATSVPVPGPVTPEPAAIPTSTPQAAVTVIRYISLPRDLRDSKLLFALQAPAEWNVSTWRLTNADTSDYRTDLVAGNIYSITSYPSTRSREQEYRDKFRQWSPPPVESTATINDIRYDRFESSAGGNTTVAYLADANSANERGYASVLVFVTRDSNRFEQEDFEKVVASFRYFSMRSAGTIPGDEIPHYDLSGRSIAGKAGTGGSVEVDSSDWDTAGSGSSGAASSSAAGSSSGGSTGGGGCHRG